MKAERLILIEKKRLAGEQPMVDSIGDLDLNTLSIAAVIDILRQDITTLKTQMQILQTHGDAE